MKFLSKLLLPKIYYLVFKYSCVLSKDAHTVFFIFVFYQNKERIIQCCRSYAVFIPVVMEQIKRGVPAIRTAQCLSIPLLQFGPLQPCLSNVTFSRESRYSQHWMYKVNKVGQVSLVQDSPANGNAEIHTYILGVCLSDIPEWIFS